MVTIAAEGGRRHRPTCPSDQASHVSRAACTSHPRGVVDVTATVANDPRELPLSLPDLREVTRYAAACAQEILSVFEAAHPDDDRPHAAIAAAWAFVRGGERGKLLRDTAWAALRAAKDTHSEAAGCAARAAMCAASAAYLHPLADAHQLKHILGAAAYAARAAELVARDPCVGDAHITRTRRRATPPVIAVLRRYPAAPPGGGRVGELLRSLDAALRGPT